MGFFDFFKKKNNKEEIEEVIEDINISDQVEDDTETEVKEDTAQDNTETETETEAEEDVAQENTETEVEEDSINFFQKILLGLDATRKSILSGIEKVLKGFTKIDDELYEELEEALIMADIGVNTSLEIIEKLRIKVKEKKINEPEKLMNELIQIITEILLEDEEDWEIKTPTVMLVIGVNGVGKTTTIGKLMNIYKENGHKVLVAAADTFRAAAIEQLEIWGERSKIDVIRQQEGSDPGAVVFDAISAAKARNVDILIVDTAGRLHNKKNLMEELRKISRIIEREYPEAKKEVLLVLDATTGQNAISQAKLFKETTDLTGIALTKLDGTAKGGVIIAIKNEMDIPVRYIGIGEQINDLQRFDAEEFVKALFN